MSSTIIPISRFWGYILTFTVVCLALAISACETSVALPTNPVTPSFQPSPSYPLIPTITPSSTPLSLFITKGTLAYLMISKNNQGSIRLINVVNRETQDVEFDCYVCGTFSFSPDGTQVALTGWKEFSDNMIDEILLLNVESGEVRQITKKPLDCKKDASWSPDGKYLLYTTKDACKSLGNAIEIMEMATDATHKLTNTKGEKFNPAWSPDGKYIAYGYQEVAPGEAKSVGGYLPPPYLWLMDANGKNSHQISDMPAGFHFQISWSPDSSKIVFSSPMSCGDIYLTDIRTNKTSKFFDPDGFDLGSCATNPVWSPDGKAIAVLVTTYIPITNQVKDWEIILVSADGKNAIPIVHGKQGEQPPLYLEWMPKTSGNTPSP